MDKLLLKPDDFLSSFPTWNIDGILNPGAVRLPNEKIFLYVRMAESVSKNGDFTCPVIVSKEEYKTDDERLRHGHILSRDEKVIFLKSGICRLTNISHFRSVILSKNGLNIESISKVPDFTGTSEEGEYGVEDPRIVKIGNLYYMTYVAISKRDGVSTSLAVSKDLKNWDRKGVIFREQNKDCVLFPEKINGMYVALNRPEVFYEFHKPSIWISYSPDLIFWGKEKGLIFPRNESWENDRVGAGPPPVKTNKGWLLIYHGMVGKSKGKKFKREYNAGAVLLDLKNPEKIIARSPADKPLIIPNKEYEKKGFINNVVFPTGADIDLNKKDILIYSGGADKVISVRKININHILNSLEYF